MSLRRIAFLAAALLLAGGLRSSGQSTPTARPAAPPEAAEILKAERITDADARLKELLRIQAAYPRSAQAARLASDIRETRIDLAKSADAVVALQKAVVGAGRGTARMTSFAAAAARLLDHPRREAFDPGRVRDAVLDYRARAERAAADPETFAGMPDSEDRRQFTARTLRDFEILVARAQAGAGEGKKAVAALELYRAEGGEAGPDYFEAYGEACSALGLVRDALGYYLSAAVASRPGAEEKARAAYTALHGGDRGFDEGLERLQSALPFRPKPFAPPKRWRGKTVLVEVFTNVENPRCLAADLAAAGLIESYPDKYLAVLEYHLAVPRPDPLANDEGRTRAEHYRIGSTPTAVIDGGIRMSGSGTRAMAGTRYEQFRSQIDPWLTEEPDLRLKIKAVRRGNKIEAAASFNRQRPGAEHYLALVQDRERLKGGSGTIIHRRIVRALVRFDPAAGKTIAFDMTGIDREGLQVVYFVQDVGSRRILNAAVADVTVR